MVATTQNHIFLGAFKKFTSQNYVGTSSITVKNGTETNCEPKVNKVSKSKLELRIFKCRTAGYKHHRPT